MVRVLRISFTVIVALALVTVGLANSTIVTLKLLPDTMANFFGMTGWSVALPLSFVVLISAAFGIAIGLIWEWVRDYRKRSSAKSEARRVAKLEKEIAQLKDTQHKANDEVLSMIDNNDTTPAPNRTK